MQVQYKLEIIFVFFAYKRANQLVVAPDAVDPWQVAGWVDDRLVEFVDTYLRLEMMDQYHPENQALDPVCGMWINKNTAAARLDYRDKTYYFCLDEYRQKFAAEPRRYLGSEPPLP